MRRLSQLPKRANRILDALAEGELTMRVNAFDEQRLLTVLQRLANRLTIGLVLAATIVGAAMLMQIPTANQLFGYPALAILLFLGAALAGAVLVLWITLTDRRVTRQRRDKLPGERG